MSIVNWNLNPPCRWHTDSTNSENEIRDIFYRHWETLTKKFVEIADQLHHWRVNYIAQINQYADDQIRILREDFERQQQDLNGKCEENLDTTRAYVLANNVELFNELHRECQSLQFQVAQLESVTGTTQGYKVTTVIEQIDRKEKEKAEKFQHTDHRNETLNSQLTEHNLHLSTENFTHESSPPEVDDQSSTEHDRRHDEELRKCPICFMIFSSKMTIDDRQKHVNAHYVDD